MFLTVGGNVASERICPTERAGRWSNGADVANDTGPAPRRQRPRIGRVSRRGLVEALALLLVAVLGLFQLVRPPFVGLADNGDFARVMGAVGLSYRAADGGTTLSPPEEDRYLTATYVSIPTQFWRRPGYVTSELLPVRLAQLVNWPISPTGTLDIRTVGFTHLAFFLGALALLLRAARRLGARLHLAIAVALVALGVDVSYLAWFNSLYSDPIALIAVYLLVGAALWMALDDRPGLRHLVAFFGAGTLLTTARPQFLPLAAVAALYGGWLWRRRYGGRLRLAAASGALVMLALAVLNFAVTPWNLTLMYRYNTVFYEILGTSPTPEQDLVELGLDPALARFRGTKAWDPGVPTGDQAFADDFLRRVGTTQTLVFYARHPNRLWSLLVQSPATFFELRPDYLGNFERSSGLEPRAKAVSVSPVDALRRALPKTPWFALLLAFTTAALAWDMWRWLRARVRLSAADPAGAERWRRLQAIPPLVLALEVMAVGQWFTSLLGEGLNDLGRHLFLFNVLVDVCIVASMLWVGTRGWLALKRADAPLEGAS